MDGKSGKEITLQDILSEGNALIKLHLLKAHLNKQKVGHLMTTRFGYTTMCRKEVVDLAQLSAPPSS